MIAPALYSYNYNSVADISVFKKHIWLVILHASRVPPHVGLLIHGSYNSLTIKERELNIPSETLLKLISQKKVESLFFKISKHPVFSDDYLLQVFQEQLMQYNYVKQGENTCLSPIKQFFNEFYPIRNKEHLLFEFIESLHLNNYIIETLGLNLKSDKKENVFTFKTYTAFELDEKIKQERGIYYKD